VRSGDLVTALRSLDEDEREAARAELAHLLDLPVARLDDAAMGTSTSPEAAAEGSPVTDGSLARTIQSLRAKAREIGAI
jgi:hypothetical protein